MRIILSLAAAAGLLALSTALGLAQSTTVEKTPGHQMQQKGSMGAPGASAYAPGQAKLRKGKRGAPSTSSFAPRRHINTGNIGNSPRDHQTGQENKLAP